jgi:hypothetical protein
MTFLRGLPARLAAAVLVAAGIVVIASGVIALVAPAAGFGPLPTGSPFADATIIPSGSVEPSDAPSVEPSASPGPTPTVPVASRVVVPALRIDLAIVAQTYGPGHGSYPLCFVAQYLEDFVQPSQPGTTYIYGHAQPGMFLPLLTAYQRDGEQGLLGDLIQVYTKDGKVYLYDVFKVVISSDFSLARSVPPEEHWVLLQTSTSRTVNGPKLMVAAKLLNVADTTHAAANPTPHAVDCRP